MQNWANDEGTNMLIRADFGGGSGSPDAPPSSMTVEVDPDRLFATANELDATAAKLGDWIATNSDRFAVRPAGTDVISSGIAEFLTDTWSGPTGGMAQVHAASANLMKVAETMRTAAKNYGLTDTTNAADLSTTA